MPNQMTCKNCGRLWTLGVEVGWDPATLECDGCLDVVSSHEVLILLLQDVAKLGTLICDPDVCVSSIYNLTANDATIPAQKDRLKWLIATLSYVSEELIEELPKFLWLSRKEALEVVGDETFGQMVLNRPV